MRRTFLAIALCLVAFASIAFTLESNRPMRKYVLEPQIADLLACSTSRERAISFLQVAQGAYAFDPRHSPEVFQNPELRRAIIEGPWPLLCSTFNAECGGWVTNPTERSTATKITSPLKRKRYLTDEWLRWGRLTHCALAQDRYPNALNVALICIDNLRSEVALHPDPIVNRFLAEALFNYAGAAATQGRWDIAEVALDDALRHTNTNNIALVAFDVMHGEPMWPILAGLTRYALADLRRQGRIP